MLLRPLIALLALPLMLCGAPDPQCSLITPNSVFFVGSAIESNPSDEFY